MGLFDSAKDSLRGAVGDMAEGSVDSVKDAVQEVLQQQLEDLLGKAVVQMIASVNEELQSFAALHLATKDDIARLEALVVAASATSAVAAATAGAVDVPSPKSAPRGKAPAKTGPPKATRATAARRQRSRQA